MDSASRRRFMATGLRALACIPVAGVRLSVAAVPFVPLLQLAAKKDIQFGFALDPARLDADATYRDIVARQANIVVPENALKWQSVHPEQDRYDFAPADAIARFAQAHDQRMRGHTFCWHRALPDWVYRTVTPANADTVLTEHIRQVAGHYRGQISSWDVANEVIQLKDGQPGGLRNAFWYRMLGSRYLDMAYHVAHEADPGAVLCYNDYGLEYDSPDGESKRAAVLAMLRGFKQRGVPVHALGIQSHLRAGETHGFGPGLPRFVSALRDLGLSVYVTELDVDDSGLTGSIAARDAIVAETYRRYLDLVLGTRSVSTVITWGVWDTPHRTGATPTSGPVAERPLAFGPDGKIKPASWVVEHCFERAPSQGSH